MRATAEAAGLEVAGCCAQLDQAPGLAGQVAPDVVLVWVGLGLRRLHGLSAWPVVLAAPKTERSRDWPPAPAGMAGMIPWPLEPSRLALVLRLALVNHALAAGLQDEAAYLRRSLAERKIIERAKGIVMQGLGLSEKQARAHLEAQARDQGLGLAELAHQLVRDQ